MDKSIRAGVDTCVPDEVKALVGQKASKLPQGYAAVVTSTSLQGYTRNIINYQGQLYNINDFAGGAGGYTNCTIVKILGKLVTWEM